MNFYLSIEWGPHHQFSNWAPQVPAPALVICINLANI